MGLSTPPRPPTPSIGSSVGPSNWPYRWRTPKSDSGSVRKYALISVDTAVNRHLHDIPAGKRSTRHTVTGTRQTHPTTERCSVPGRCPLHGVPNRLAILRHRDSRRRPHRGFRAASRVWPCDVTPVSSSRATPTSPLSPKDSEMVTGGVNSSSPGSSMSVLISQEMPRNGRILLYPVVSVLYTRPLSCSIYQLRNRHQCYTVFGERLTKITH